MTRNKRGVIFLTVVVILTVILTALFRQAGYREENRTRTVRPVMGDVALTVTTTGLIQPRNRLEIKPSIGGRIDSVLVKEGTLVSEGEIMAWMSSTERAALIDAARAQGEKVLRYWEEIYKRTPIISPIDGEVIVRSVEPGQTVTASDTILVLSDRLVVSAQFDETDIGRVRIGQRAVVTLDAYPDVSIEGVVEHIAYESQIISNVTIYDVDITPDELPVLLRSGMGVSVELTEKKRSNVMTIPSSAIRYDGKRQYVLLRQRHGAPAERDITVGLNNDRLAEITEGLTPEDDVIIPGADHLPARSDRGTNPFMPFDRRRRQ
jgi:membrane fusion protein, macrolide-specific efflux system